MLWLNDKRQKKVRLANGRTIYARYKWATHADLLVNIRLERPYKQRAALKGRRRRVRQGGRGFKSTFGKLMRFA